MARILIFFAMAGLTINPKICYSISFNPMLTCRTHLIRAHGIEEIPIPEFSHLDPKNQDQLIKTVKRIHYLNDAVNDPNLRLAVIDYLNRSSTVEPYAALRDLLRMLDYSKKKEFNFTVSDEAILWLANEVFFVNSTKEYGINPKMQEVASSINGEFVNLLTKEQRILIYKAWNDKNSKESQHIARSRLPLLNTIYHALNADDKKLVEDNAVKIFSLPESLEEKVASMSPETLSAAGKGLAGFQSKYTNSSDRQNMFIAIRSRLIELEQLKAGAAKKFVKDYFYTQDAKGERRFIFAENLDFDLRYALPVPPTLKGTERKNYESRMNASNSHIVTELIWREFVKNTPPERKFDQIQIDRWKDVNPRIYKLLIDHNNKI